MQQPPRQQALLAFLDPAPDGLGLPADMVSHLHDVQVEADALMRVAVLDRRVSGWTWEEIAEDAGVTHQALRQRYVRRVAPDRAEDQPRPKRDRDAFYADFPDLATGWWNTSRVRAPFGTDYGRIVDDDGTTWLLTVCTSEKVARLVGIGGGRFGTYGNDLPCVVTATPTPTPPRTPNLPILVLSDVTRLGTAARALRTIPRKCNPDEVAAAIGNELRQERAIQHLLDHWQSSTQ